MLSTRETNWFPQCLLRMGREKTDLVLLGSKAQRLRKREGKGGGRGQPLIYKRKCASTLTIGCVSLPQSPSSQQSSIFFFFFSRSFQGSRKDMVLTGQHVCLVLGLLVKSQGWVGFQVWSQENTLLKCPHICSMTLGLDALYWVQPPSDLFPRKDCLHEILLGMNAVSGVHQGQQPPNFKGSSPHRSLQTGLCPQPAPKRSVSREGTVTCIGESKGWFPAMIPCLCGDGQWELLS